MAVLRTTYNFYVEVGQEAQKEIKEIKVLIKELYKPLNNNGPANSHNLFQIDELKKVLNTKKEIVEIVHRVIHTSNLSHSKQQRLNELISKKI